MTTLALPLRASPSLHWWRQAERDDPFEALDCPACSGVGSIDSFRDYWDADAELHYTVDVTRECKRCDGNGTLPVDQLTEEEQREAGYRFDDDGVLWRRMP